MPFCAGFVQSERSSPVRVMAGAMEDDAVQVVVESSWTVLQGSLDSCVTVVFLDPASQEPVIPSSPRAAGKVVLVPPSEPVPCEITVKFQGRLCHVQSFYTLSTARICELYSQAKLEMDFPEYICTVKGWIPVDDKSSNGEDAGIVSASWEVENAKQGNGVPSIQEGKTDIFEGTSNENAMPTPRSLTNALNSIRSEGDDLERSVYSSGEDSWVEIKFSGSLSGESPFGGDTVLDRDGRNVDTNQGESGHFENQLVACRLISKATSVEINNEHDACSEEKMQSMQHVVPSGVQQEFYEAELELVDQSPWAALTIRLLSLQDKCRVEIDQMVFLAVSCPPAPELASPHRSAEGGANSDLLAMFVPSMLQMAQVVLSGGTNLMKFGTSRPCERALDTMDRLPVERDEIGVSSCKNSLIKSVPVQKDIPNLPAHVYHLATCEASRTDCILKSEESDRKIMQKRDASGVGFRGGEESGEQPLQPGVNVLSRFECPPHLCEPPNGSLTRDLFHTLETFSERFDRLESVCVRMESYLQRTVERLEQRITHLEVQHSKASGERAPVDVSLDQSHPSVDTSLEQRHHTAGEPCLSSSMQYPFEPILSPGSESNVEVSSLLTQFTKDDNLGAQDIHKETLNPSSNDIVDTVESSCSVIKNVIREISSGTQALASGPPTIPANQSRKSCQSLDAAWASALSAFASSYTPVVYVDSEDSEDTLKCLGDNQSSYLPSDGSTSRLQSCKTFKEENFFSRENSRADVDSDADVICDVDSEVVNSDYGPSSEDLRYLSDCEVNRQSTGDVWPHAYSKEKEDKGLPCHPLDFSTLPCADLDGILFKEDQGMPSKSSAAGTEADVDTASIEELSKLRKDTQLPCPQFDVFASMQYVDSNSTLFKEAQDFSINNSATAVGFKNGSSPVFDSSAQTQQASTLSFDNSDLGTAFHHHKANTVYTSPIHCQEKGDLSLSEGKNSEILISLTDDTSDGDASGVWSGPRPIPSKFGELYASCFEGRDDRTLDDSNNHVAVDWLSCSLSTEPLMVVSGLETLYSNRVSVLSSQVQHTTKESFSGTCSSFLDGVSNAQCEVEEAFSSPDLLVEHYSNYQGDRACSEDSLCFSQDFDTCQNDLCDDEWSSAQNIFHLQDPELADDETNSPVVDIEENFLVSASNLLGGHWDGHWDRGSTQDPLFWPCPPDAKGDQQHYTTVFQGFENIS